MTMAKLRLGDIPDDKPVRMTITISGELRGRLQAYAQAWTAETGRAIELQKLLPAMLDHFVRSDRVFMRQRRSVTRAGRTSADAVSS
jgi:hypothetical protein